MPGKVIQKSAKRTKERSVESSCPEVAGDVTKGRLLLYLNTQMQPTVEHIIKWIAYRGCMYLIAELHYTILRNFKSYSNR